MIFTLNSHVLFFDRIKQFDYIALDLFLKDMWKPRFTHICKLDVQGFACNTENIFYTHLIFA